MGLAPTPHPRAHGPHLQPDTVDSGQRFRIPARTGRTLRDQSGAILDGHHRERACRELGIEPRYEVQYCADDSDRKVRALVMNLLRRHLTREQKAKAVAELRGLGYTFERIAAETGMSYGTVQGLATQSDEFIKIDKLVTDSNCAPQTVTGKDGKVYPASALRHMCDEVELPPLPKLTLEGADTVLSREQYPVSASAARVHGPHQDQEH